MTIQQQLEEAVCDYVDYDVAMTRMLAMQLKKEMKDMFKGAYNVKLKTLKLRGTPEQEYHLSATYEYETDDGVYKATFPRIILPIMKDRMPYVNSDCDYFSNAPVNTVNLGFGVQQMGMHNEHNGTEPYVYKVETIKEKTHKMTIAEIEKKLGYKIEIVAEKETK